MIGTLDNTYLCMHSTLVEVPLKRKFWESLEAHDTLKFRWSETPFIDVDEVMEEDSMQKHQYYVIDYGTGSIIAEFALDIFTGKAAQVHFCMHPENAHSLNKYLFDAVADQILYQWQAEGNSPYLDTVFGLTPTKNRVACLFVRGSKFKKVGVLPNGCSYLGKASDGLITAKTRT